MKNTTRQSFVKRAAAFSLAAALMLGLTPANVFADETKDTYVLMNIPYADFYAAEVNNRVEVDAFTSATKSKPRTGNLSGGSYHVNADGSDITGITYAVKVGSGVDLSKYKQITDADEITIETTNRGTTSSTTYKGSQTLFENPSYAYYVLSEKPSSYKELTDTNGTLSFGKVQGDIKDVSTKATFTTNSSYGDYQLDLDTFNNDITTVYGIVLETKEGSSYGLRHMENIWLQTKLAWSTGFTSQVHGCPTSSAHYAAMMGQTVTDAIYYTNAGTFKVDFDDVYIPKKFNGSVSVEDAALAAGTTTVSLKDFPTDYAADYSVKELEGASVAGNALTFPSNAAPGVYTLVVSDKNKVYSDYLADFTLSTDKLPASYDSSVKKITGTDAAAVTAYLKAITSVKVDDTPYMASGRGSVAIIKEDGSIDEAAASQQGAVFSADKDYTCVVSAAGYPDLTFTYTKGAAAADDTNTDTTVTNETDNTADTAAVKIGKVSKITVKASKKQLKIAFKKAADVSGYQIQYSANKNFKNAKTLDTKKTSAVIKKLKSGKKYYVRVRAYKTIDNENTYGSWKAVSAKIK